MKEIDKMGNCILFWEKLHHAVYWWPQFNLSQVAAMEHLDNWQWVPHTKLKQLEIQYMIYQSPL